MLQASIYFIFWVNSMSEGVCGAFLYVI